MIRKLLLPALATALLAGCVTSGYQYRGGSGDYYYGQPSTQYRYYGAPYGSYGYGYPGGWGGSIGYGYYPDGYYPYGYYGYGGYPYYRYPYRPPVVIVRPAPGGGDSGNTDHGKTDIGDRPRPPWRDLGSIGRRDPVPAQGSIGRRDPVPAQGSGVRQRPPAMSMPQPRSMPQAARSGPVMGETVRRSRADSDKRRTPTP